MYTCAGKLANVVGKICSRRLTRTSKNTLTPFYGVKIGASPQANIYFVLNPFNIHDSRFKIHIIYKDSTTYLLYLSSSSSSSKEYLKCNIGKLSV
jgi:hypothetical protein